MIELDDNPDSWVPRVWRATALARAGDHVRAAFETDAIDAHPGLSDDGRYNQAATLALAADAALKDARLGLLIGSVLADRYAARALERLRRLRDTGCFDDPADVMLLARDPDFHSLWGRPDFRQLLEEIQHKK